MGAQQILVTSPDGKVAVGIQPDDQGKLSWTATLEDKTVIEPSALGLIVDGVNLGDGAQLQRTDRYRVDERYPWRGGHSTAVNRATGTRLSFKHGATGTRFTIDARAMNDAVAVRFIVDGSGRAVPDAGMIFRLPANSVVWSHGLRDHYEAQYERRTAEELPEGAWAAPPVTFKLPDGGGYASITEADLRGYAGMALQVGGLRALRERLGHSHPPSYPYTLRYGEENARRLAVAAPVEGPIRTPWRVVILCRDLNALVNSDAVHNLSAAPDKSLFPDGLNTAWLKPGRAVWRYLDGGDSTPEGIQEFSKLAADLGFEHQVVEGQWQRWSDERLRDVVEYSRARNVGIWVWRHSNTLGDAEARRALFASLQKAGVVGVKVDFLDHEAKEIIDLYEAILKDAAEFKLMINFHGANKPAGESRTWPNEMTREGIFGMEHRRVEAWAVFNTTFPFVRMLAGHADYTPVVFGERRKETSWAHQIATAAVLTSPVLVYGGHPASLIANPAVEMIKSIPSVWDQTIVLPPSEIGELAIFARRSGNRWFIAALNGAAAREVAVPLGFLDSGNYHALIVRDNLDDAAAVLVEHTRVDRGAPVKIAMRAGGGYIMRLTR